MADVLKLTVLSPQRKLLEGARVTSVTLTGSEGEIQILPGHARMAGTLESGVFIFAADDLNIQKGRRLGAVSSGFFRVENDQVTIMAETLEFADEINVERAKDAQRRAEEKLKQSDLEPHEFEKQQLKVQRAVIRQQVAARSVD